MDNPFSAAPSMMGYLYQVRFALFRLLEAGQGDAMTAISVEQLDDVSVQGAATPNELIQLKHSVVKRPGNLTNTSTDLWKTLRIWCDFIAKGTIDPTQTLFTLVTTAVAGEGSAASKLRPANRDEISALEALLDAVRSSSNKSSKNAHEAFLSLDELKRRQLIENLQVLDNSGTIRDVKDLIERELWLVTNPDHIDYFRESLEGWWNERVIKHLFHDVHGSISVAELRGKIDDLRQQFDLEHNLPNNFPDPLNIDESELSQDLQVFVEQLRLLFDRDVRIRKAISDYFRAFQQRTLWVSKGVLFHDDLDLYERRLKDEWEREFEHMHENLEDAEGEEEKRRAGRELYYWMDGKADIRIKPKFDDPFLMRGSYHMLANRLEVGWHTEFLERLQHLLREVV